LVNFWDDLNDTDHLSKKDAQKQGSFYTPRDIAMEMADKLEWKSDQKILDPCCGRGALFQACLEKYGDLTNDLIYGIDIDPIAISFCISHFPGGHFQVGDCLVDDIIDDEFWRKDPFERFSDYKDRTGYRGKFRFGMISG
jgi:SAM-dependent methyltransferase